MDLLPDVMLKIRLTPRGSKNEVLGWDGDTLRIKVTAPPVEGAANKACVDFIAGLLGVKRSQVSLASGEKSRDKTIRLSGTSESELEQTLGTKVSASERV